LFNDQGSQFIESTKDILMLRFLMLIIEKLNVLI
jgi:hypothetical protein